MFTNKLLYIKRLLHCIQIYISSIQEYPRPIYICISYIYVQFQTSSNKNTEKSTLQEKQKTNKIKYLYK